MPVQIPTLETERLILRGRKLEDFPAFAAFWGDPDTVRYLGGKPLTREQAWTKMARMEGFWALTGYGLWVVEEKNGNGFLGEVGPADFKRDIDPPLDGMIEFGWNLTTRVQGKGYATEALSATIEWAGANLPKKPYCCIIGENNVASIRVAEKCGFHLRSKTTYLGDPTLVFERPPA